MKIVALTPQQRQRIIRGFGDLRSVVNELQLRPVRLPESQMWHLVTAVGLLERLVMANANAKPVQIQKDQS